MFITKAVSTIRSDYHLKHLKSIFLLKGGDEDWLLYGLEVADEKIQKLSKINNKLAHMPWKLTRKDIDVIILLNSRKYYKGVKVDGIWMNSYTLQ